MNVNIMGNAIFIFDNIILQYKFEIWYYKSHKLVINDNFRRGGGDRPIATMYESPLGFRIDQTNTDQKLNSTSDAWFIL